MRLLSRVSIKFFEAVLRESENEPLTAEKEGPEILCVGIIDSPGSYTFEDARNEGRDELRCMDVPKVPIYPTLASSSR